MARDTRTRILAAALDLFGRQGFAATSIAQIEEAAGLSPGSGALYRHFPSKEAMLSIGVRERIESRNGLIPKMDAPPSGVPVEAVLRSIAELAFDRLEDERDISRILVHDLAERPELLGFFRDAEVRTNHASLVGALQQLLPRTEDPEALAAILIDAVSHYWLVADLFGGTHPTGVPRERYLTALVALAAKDAS